jgi:hypothetical protein
VAKLIYSAIASLDGYVADADGAFDWSAPDEEVHAFVKRPRAGGRDPPLRAPHVRGHGRLGDDRRRVARRARLRGDSGRAADKVVYSRTLEAVASARTRIERAFDPEAIGRMKASAAR